MKIQGYIYKLELKENLESFKKGEIYMGKHNGRKTLYFSGGKIINRILKKYSEGVFDRQIICNYIESNELLCFMERYYIEYFQCNRNKFKSGLNLTDGGEGIFGFKKTKEQCEELSKRVKEEYKKGLRTTPTGKDVHQYNIDSGDYIKTYKNCTEAAIDIGQPAKSNTSIAAAARDKNASAYGYIWSYRKMTVIDKQAGIYNPILQYDLNGNLINEYKNPVQAALKNNFKTYSSIHNCASGRSKTSYGFIWKFKKVENEFN